MKQIESNFYTYYQNNTGGDFEINKQHGICEIVIIEANSHTEANSIANNIGLYFDGCENGIDCNCCGDRWYEVGERDAEKTPLIYGKSVFDYKQSMFKNYCYIHYLNGEIEHVKFK